MRERLCQACSRLWQDAKEYWWIVPGFLVYYLITKFLFGQICPFRILFGIPCPGCGMTRSLFLLLQGRFLDALAMQPMVLAFLVLAAAFVVTRYVLEYDVKCLNNALLAALIFCILLYVVRMLLYFPRVPPMTIDEDALLRRFWRLLT